MPHYNHTGAPDGGAVGPSDTRRYVRLLQERFPHIQSVSLQLLEQHETFRELCEEYLECTEAAQRLEQAAAGEDALRREYNALRLRLEAELLRYISEHGGGTAR